MPDLYAEYENLYICRVCPSASAGFDIYHSYTRLIRVCGIDRMPCTYWHFIFHRLHWKTLIGPEPYINIENIMFR